MKKVFQVTLVGAILSVGVACGSTTQTAESTERSWSYEGKTGPNKWASLSYEWEACKNSDGQTPIDLRPTEANLPDLEFFYNDVAAEVFNNGHTIEAEVSEESTNFLIIKSLDNNNADNNNAGNNNADNDKEFKFLQMHFHAPSEHKLDGQIYPVEVHFVNKSDDGELAVVGVFIKRGTRDNQAWDPFIEHLSLRESDNPAEAEIDFNALLPSNRRTIQYSGSLTTPPCSDGVRWNVMSTVVELSRRQIAAFKKAYWGNNRPIQSAGDRLVQIDTDVAED